MSCVTGFTVPQEFTLRFGPTWVRNLVTQQQIPAFFNVVKRQILVLYMPHL